MDKIKKSCLFRIISLVLILTFISLDISYAYPPEHNPSNSTLATPSPLQQQPVNEHAARFQQSVFSQGALLASVYDIGEYFFGNTEKGIGSLPSKYAEDAMRADLRKHLSDTGTEIINIVPVEYIKKTAPEKLKAALDEIGFKGTLPDEGVVFILYRKAGKKFLVQIAKKGEVRPENLPGYEWVVSDKYLVKYMPEDYKGPVAQITQALMTPVISAVETKEEPKVTITEPIAEVAVPEAETKEAPTAPKKFLTIRAILKSLIIIPLISAFAFAGDSTLLSDPASILSIIKDFAVEYPVGVGIIGIGVSVGLFFAIWRTFFPISWHLWRIRHYASGAHVERLIKIGPSAVPPLLEILTNENSSSYLKQCAIEALGGIGDSRAVILLITIIENKKGETLLAIEALGHMKDQRAQDMLIKLLRNQAAIIRKSAAETLKTMGWRPGNKLEKIWNHIALQEWEEVVDVEAIPFLIEIIENKYLNEPCKEARDVLIKIGKPAVPALIKVLKSTKGVAASIAAIALGTIQDLRAVEPLVKALKYEYECMENTFISIANALIKINGEYAVPFCVEPLIKILKGRNSAYHNEVRDILAKIGKPAVPALITALKENNPEWEGLQGPAARAAEVLGKIKDPLAIEPLIEALKIETADENSVAIVKALLSIKNSNNVDFLLSILAHTKECSKARMVVVDALGKTGDPRIIVPLTKLLDSDKTGNIILALGSIRDERVLEPLIRILNDADHSARATAARMLLQQKDSRMEALVGYLGIVANKPSDHYRLPSSEEIEAMISALKANKDIKANYMPPTTHENSYSGPYGEPDYYTETIVDTPATIVIISDENSIAPKRPTIREGKKTQSITPPFAPDVPFWNLEVHSSATQGLFGKSIADIVDILGKRSWMWNSASEESKVKAIDRIKLVQAQLLTIIETLKQNNVISSSERIVSVMLMGSYPWSDSPNDIDIIVVVDGERNFKRIPSSGFATKHEIMPGLETSFEVVGLETLKRAAKGEEFDKSKIIRRKLITYAGAIPLAGMDLFASARPPLESFRIMRDDLITDAKLANWPEIKENAAKVEAKRKRRAEEAEAMRVWIERQSQPGSSFAINSIDPFAMILGMAGLWEGIKWLLNEYGCIAGPVAFFLICAIIGSIVALIGYFKDDILPYIIEGIKINILVKRTQGKNAKSAGILLNITKKYNANHRRGMNEIWIKKIGKDAVVPLVRIIKDKYSDCRIQAINILQKISIAIPEVAPSIILSLKNEDGMSLFSILQDKNMDVRLNTASFLKSLQWTPADINEEMAYVIAINSWTWLKEIEVPLTNSLRKFLMDWDPSVRKFAAEMLARTKDPQNIPFLIRRLTDESSSVRKAVAETLNSLGWAPSNAREKAMYFIADHDWTRLSAIGKPAAPFLCKRLADADPLVRMFARQILLKMGMSATPYLIKALNENNLDIRVVAAQTLGEIKDPRAVEPLIKALNKDLDIRVVAAEALGEIKDPRAVEPLINILSSPDLHVRSAVSQSLSKIGVSSIPYLVKVLSNDNSDVRSSAAQILNMIGWKPINAEEEVLYLIAANKWFELVKVGVPAVPSLIKSLSDSNPNIRVFAAQALGEIKDSRAVEPLMEALSDNNSSVRFASGWALEQIGWKPKNLNEQKIFLDVKKEWVRKKIMAKIEACKMDKPGFKCDVDINTIITDVIQDISFNDELKVELATERIVTPAKTHEEEETVYESYDSYGYGCGSSHVEMRTILDEPERDETNVIAIRIERSVPSKIGYQPDELRKVVNSVMAELKQQKDVTPQGLFKIVEDRVPAFIVNLRLALKDLKPLSEKQGVSVEEISVAIKNVAEAHNLDNEATKILWLALTGPGQGGGEVPQKPLEGEEKNNSRMPPSFEYPEPMSTPEQDIGVSAIEAAAAAMGQTQSTLDLKAGTKSFSAGEETSKATQLFEIVESSLNNQRVRFIDAGNQFINSLPAQASPANADNIGNVDKNMATAEIRQRVERAIAVIEGMEQEKIPPETKVAIELLKKNLNQFEADGGVASIIILARRAKRENQKLIIGLETDWIPGMSVKGSLQRNAITAFMKEIYGIAEALKSMGLDNVEIIRGSGSELANALLSEADRTHTRLHNVVVMASVNTINSDSFARLKNADESDRPFLAGIDPAELIKFYEKFGEATSKQLYIRLASLLYMTLELAAGKEPPQLPIIISYDKKMRMVIFLPKAELVDYEVLKNTYAAEKTALSAA